MKRAADEQRLAEFRGLREDAWRIVKDDLTRLQSDLEDRGIGERIKDRIGEEAHDVWDATREIAFENKGIVAGTVAALVGWLLRGPIVAAFTALFGPGLFGDPDKSGRHDDSEQAEQDASETVLRDKGDIP